MSNRRVPNPQQHQGPTSGRGGQRRPAQRRAPRPRFSERITAPFRAARAPRGPNGSRRPRTKKQWAFFFLKWGSIAGLMTAAIGLAIIALMFWRYGADDSLPSVASLKNYEPPQVSRVLAADGNVVGEIYAQRRSFVEYEKLPKHLVQAFLAAEDAKFFEHDGIDYMGMLRALFVNIKSGKKAQGASTITQQVVKNMLLTSERTFKRKFQEIILARRLEKALTKEEILTLYANQIFFGHGRYGVQEASRYYFGKNVQDLSVGEAAVLAGLPKGPNNYSPKKKKNHKRAKDRQIYVLGQMARNGFITPQEAQEWADKPIQVVSNAFPTLGDAPEWVEMVRGELTAKYGEDGLKSAGVTAVATVDLAIQKQARDALQKGLRELDKRQGYGHPLKSIKEKRRESELRRLAKALPRGGPKKGAIYRAMVMEVHDADEELVVDLGGWKASVVLESDDPRYNPDNKKPSERFKVGDLVRVMSGADVVASYADLDLEPEARKKLEDRDGDVSEPKHTDRLVKLATGPEGAVVVIDIETRKVLAVVGGYDSRIAQFNRATQARRQAGSTFKPFVYAAALDSGDFTAASIVNDTPEVFDLWRPQNYKKGKFEGPVNLRYALARSINTVAIKVAHDVTPARVAEVAKALGVESPLPDGLSIALGSGEVTPLELTNAFASLAAGGRSVPPQIITRLGDEPVANQPGIQALRPEVAYVTLSMMRSVITAGTGGRARVLRLDIAGKTGTSDDARDAWFVGVTPKLAVGVWVGFDNFRRSLGRGEHGGRSALPVYVELMKGIGKTSARFSAPDGIVSVKIDQASGLLAAPGVKKGVITEVFVAGTEPKEYAAAPGEVDADDFVNNQYDTPASSGDGDDDDDDPYGDDPYADDQPAPKPPKPPTGARPRATKP